MAKTKTRRTNPPQNQNPNPPTNPEQREGDEGPSSLIDLLTSSISLTLSFLSSNDLRLHPSQSLLLSSLLRSSSLLLLLPLPLPHISPPQIPKLPSPLPPPAPSFPWFRRFLASSTSPNDPRWLDNFRMSKPSFYLLLQALTPSLLSLSTSPSPSPPDHKLAAALFRLSHAAPYAFVAHRFGLGSSSLACRAFYEVVKAVANELSHLFELSSQLPRILQGFNWMSLPNCCGALSFFRVPVEGEFRGGSVIGQFLVDSEGRFLDVSVGWHGSMSAESVLMRTKLFTAQDMVLGNGVSEPKYFIGGSCCPLLPWLLTPYKNLDSSSSKEVAFNMVHARGMELADRAIGKLRARWKLLKTEWKEECVEALPYVVVASCLLHNFLNKCSEKVVEEAEGWMETGFADFEGKADERGERIRDVLASQMSQRYRLKSSCLICQVLRQRCLHLPTCKFGNPDFLKAAQVSSHGIKLWK